MSRRGYQAWGFRRVRIGEEEYAVFRVFLGAEGEVLAYQRWDRRLATRAEVELADLCRSSPDPPLEEGDLLALPELPGDLVLNGLNTDLALRFVRLFLEDPAFAALVTDALKHWEDFRATGSLEALARFEWAVHKALERLGVGGECPEPGPGEEGDDTSTEDAAEEANRAAGGGS